MYSDKSNNNYLPILRAYNQHCSLIVGTASHRKCVQAANLFTLVLVQRFAVPILVSQKRPHLDCARRRQSQHDVVFKRMKAPVAR